MWNALKKDNLLFKTSRSRTLTWAILERRNNAGIGANIGANFEIITCCLAEVKRSQMTLSHTHAHTHTSTHPLISAIVHLLFETFNFLI